MPERTGGGGGGGDTVVGDLDIDGLTTLNAQPVPADFLPLRDTSAGADRKVSLNNFGIYTFPDSSGVLRACVEADFTPVRRVAFDGVWNRATQIPGTAFAVTWTAIARGATINFPDGTSGSFVGSYAQTSHIAASDRVSGRVYYNRSSHIWWLHDAASWNPKSTGPTGWLEHQANEEAADNEVSANGQYVEWGGTVRISSAYTVHTAATYQWHPITTGGVHHFSDLQDTPAGLTADRMYRVNAAGDALIAISEIPDSMIPDSIARDSELTGGGGGGGGGSAVFGPSLGTYTKSSAFTQNVMQGTTVPVPATTDGDALYIQYQGDNGITDYTIIPLQSIADVPNLSSQGNSVDDVDPNRNVVRIGWGQNDWLYIGVSSVAGGVGSGNLLIAFNSSTSLYDSGVYDFRLVTFGTGGSSAVVALTEAQAEDPGDDTQGTVSGEILGDAIFNASLHDNIPIVAKIPATFMGNLLYLTDEDTAGTRDDRTVTVATGTAYHGWSDGDVIEAIGSKDADVDLGPITAIVVEGTDATAAIDSIVLTNRHLASLIDHVLINLTLYTVSVADDHFLGLPVLKLTSGPVRADAETVAINLQFTVGNSYYFTTGSTRRNLPGLYKFTGTEYIPENDLERTGNHETAIAFTSGLEFVGLADITAPTTADGDWMAVKLVGRSDVWHWLRIDEYRAKSADGIGSTADGTNSLKLIDGELDYYIGYRTNGQATIAVGTTTNAGLDGVQIRTG